MNRQYDPITETKIRAKWWKLENTEKMKFGEIQETLQAREETISTAWFHLQECELFVDRLMDSTLLLLQVVFRIVERCHEHQPWRSEKTNIQNISQFWEQIVLI